MTTPSAPCSCPVPAHHYGSPSSCPRPAAPGMPLCYGCYSAGHDRLGPCSPASHRRDSAHDSRPASRDLCGDCSLLGDPGSYAPFATRYGTCAACGSDALVTRATKLTVSAARTMLAASDGHDPSGRLCALAGRKAAGHDVDDFCRPCYADAARSSAS